MGCRLTAPLLPERYSVDVILTHKNAPISLGAQRRQLQLRVGPQLLPAHQQAAGHTLCEDSLLTLGLAALLGVPAPSATDHLLGERRC